MGDPDRTVVITVRGDLDGGADLVLGTVLDQVLDRPAPRIVIDVSGVGRCDAAGLRSFLTGHGRAHAAGGWLCLAAPGGPLRELLAAVGPARRPEVYPSVADALADAPDL